MCRPAVASIVPNLTILLFQATISPYQARLAQSGGSHVVHAPSGKAAKWAKTMDNFFHPVKGMKLDDATRIRLDKVSPVALRRAVFQSAEAPKCCLWLLARPCSGCHP